jgi:TetR/AcrR family transcriptional regulator, regulator of cefoperazone and chloramphenicol sensitivity
VSDPDPDPIGWHHNPTYCIDFDPLPARIDAGNQLEALFPQLAAEWHPTRNAGIKPYEFARTRLIQAAASCFAARGYSGTSVGDITARADCNVGAVNYYFGGKHGLYVATFEERIADLTQRCVGALRALSAEPKLDLERVLETFANAFLAPLTSGARGHETTMLLMREFVDGHLPASLIADRMIRPTLGALLNAADQSCPGVARDRLQLCCHSLVAQLLHVIQMQRLHARSASSSLPGFSIEETVAHIVQFTAAGIRGYVEEAQR